ncbi:PEP-utilizing enzyme [Paraburkholderia sp. BCC1886]|uniref:PEP-utilizing enzyme n=1 Tax=Paraburkholderia sp. BCC1886 TaxID=2562670 RepID=UPI00118395D1|nr:PEP-utilizing enzyme [Paraburkholderia sp. BCC1886]
MLEYIYGGEHVLTHVLNARRLGAGAPSSHTPDEDSAVIAMGDFLLEDDRVARIVAASRADIDLFVSGEPAPYGIAHELAAQWTLDRSIDMSHVVGLHVRRGVLAAMGNSSSPDLNIQRHIIARPLLCTPGFSIQQHALTTKGATLRFFAGLLTDATIDPGLLVTRAEWCTERQAFVDRVIHQESPIWIARSSAVSEDSFTSSNAGAYTSVMNVDGRDGDAIAQAVDTVFHSYGRGSPHDQVLLQRQIVDAAMSGVCASRVVGRNAPYFVVNYDDSSGRTDTVTSGTTNALKTLYVSRTAHAAQIRAPRSVRRLLAVVRDIERCADHTALDVEFIVDRAGIIHIVQIRPLVGDYGQTCDAAVEARIRSSMRLMSSRQITGDGILQGEKAIFGIMPDANPAELIGIKPRPLAFSLYQRLITDSVVTNQRLEYGYRDVRPVQHMLRLGGNPYIDVRSSFNSFTPAALSPTLANKLLNLYVARLECDPGLHDKVEFEVVVSTWFPGLANWLQARYGEALCGAEIAEICAAAKDIFHSALRRVEADHTDVESYGNLFDAVMSSGHEPLHKAWRLIEICHHHGCKPFAHLARAAFVAVSTLKGLVNVGVLDRVDYENYLHSIQSISGEMERDAVKVQTGELARTLFYERYGHLRPGTYDILSPAYFEDPARYLDPFIDAAKAVDKSGWTLPPTTIAAVNAALSDEFEGLSFETVDRFARRAIHGREYGKFVYTRYLSHGLNQLLLWGEQLGLTRDDLAYLHLHDLDELISGMRQPDVAQLKATIGSRRVDYDLDSRIELPDLVFSPADFLSFHKRPGQPNFITNLAVDAGSVNVLATSDPRSLELAGRIAVVESADPGFDWLFGHSIAGLITRYGGANSHMAIRCAELGVAAAIGVGDVLYGKVEQAARIVLDCHAKRITVVQTA